MRVAIDFDGGDQYLEQATAEAGDDEALLGRIVELRGWLDVVHRAELDKGEQLAHRALEIATRLGDPVMEMLAASTAALAGLLLGRPRPDLMARALELARTTQGPRLGRGPIGVHGRHCLWCGQLREARAVLESTQRRDRARRPGVPAPVPHPRPGRSGDRVPGTCASPPTWSTRAWRPRPTPATRRPARGWATRSASSAPTRAMPTASPPRRRSSGRG